MTCIDIFLFAIVAARTVFYIHAGGYEGLQGKALGYSTPGVTLFLH